jgi:acetate kinase
VILALNAGSSSIKFSLFSAASGFTRICEGAIEGLGDAARFTAKDSKGAVLVDRPLTAASTHEDSLKTLFSWFETQFGKEKLHAAGHRIVHGGARYIEPVVIDPRVLRDLHDLIPLAPLHQPHGLAGIEAVAKLDRNLPQIACFDTAFHHTESSVATAFALPRDLTDEGIRRYGFHGLSYEFIASMLPQILGPDTAERRIVVAHLGSGASLCAMRARKSVATTMSFSTLDGLMMGRRSGAIDPGVILYLLQHEKMTAEAVSDLLYNRSGLLGVSGISDDMRVLLASDDENAKAAIDLFVYRISREIGSLAAALGGLDALVFTGGIGEHAAEIRRRICEDAAWLGVELDEEANAAGGPCISRSKVSAWIVPTDEDLMIARHTVSLVGTSAN